MSERAGGDRFRTLARTIRHRPVIVAHRGDSFHAPENTLEAAERGHAAGADAWEFDVHLTRDGIPVVIHDESLRRTTDVARRFPDDERAGSGYLVSDFDLAEIQDLDAGSWFLDPRGGVRTAADFGTREALDPAESQRFTSGRVRVPTLEEALWLTDRLDWLANVELKSFPERPPGLLEKVLDAVDATGTADRVLISSFDHAEIGALKAARPGDAAGALVSTPLFRPASYISEALGADFYHPSAQNLGSESVAYRRRPCAATLRGEDLRALAGREIPVLVYTVNDRRPDGLAVHLHQAGVLGFFTDDPRGMRGRFPT